MASSRPSLFARLKEAILGAPQSGEIGFAGSKIFGSIDLGEYNPDLRGTAAIRIADKMRRTCGQIRAVEKSVSLPIRGTTWLVEEPDGAGSAEREAAELLRENLFGGMETSFDDLLREACLAIYFGFRVPEVVWEEREGLLAVRKVASRNPELLTSWLYDETGTLVGYQYEGQRPVGTGLVANAVSNNRFERVAIPIEKALHFAYDSENENPGGFGLWRSQYPHWYYLTALYKIMGIGVERNLLGTPIGELQESAGDAERRKLLAILSRWRAAEDAAIVLPHGQKVHMEAGAPAFMDAMPLLYHHLAMISVVALAQFLNLGMQSVGTQGLGETHATLFMQAEEANAKWIESVLNQQLVRRWCLLNYGEGLRCPEIRHAKITARSPANLATALNTLVTGTLLHPTPDDEAFLRDVFDLPLIPKEQLAKLGETQPEPVGETGTEDEMPGEKRETES